MSALGELVGELDRHGVMVQSHFIYGFPTVDEPLLAAGDGADRTPIRTVVFLPYSNKERVAASRLPQIPLASMLTAIAR